ncbi:MAG: hypothetical protein HQL58_13150 [Magnetococcales bacterium]|nr:hypothetical protein [Magnetococcales bacterium]
MDDQERLLHASSRVALAALLHDIGKFRERAVNTPIDKKGNDGNIATYCPFFKGYHSHKHAAYSAMAIDSMEGHLPNIIHQDMTPFSSWGDANRRDDSLINAAAMHHKPETPLQRMVATADRLASGFERSDFDDYNQAEEEQEQGRVNYLRARMWPLLGTLGLDGKQDGGNQPRPAQYS